MRRAQQYRQIRALDWLRRRVRGLPAKRKLDRDIQAIKEETPPVKVETPLRGSPKTERLSQVMAAAKRASHGATKQRPAPVSRAKPSPRAITGEDRVRFRQQVRKLPGRRASGPWRWLKLYWRKVGAGSLFLSVTIHTIAALLALLLIVQTHRPPAEDFLPGGGRTAGTASEEVAHQIQSHRARRLTQNVPTQRVVSASTSSILKLSDLPMELSDSPPANLMGAPRQAMGLGVSGAGGGFGDGSGLGGKSGFSPFSPMLESRCGNVERLQKLKETGGSSESEAAVARSLHWLKTQQNEDGSWGATYKCAMTGLALLCYLGHCETPESSDYGNQVMKGLMYLMEVQSKSASGIFSTNPASTNSVYEHGICTYAFGETYTLARLGHRSLPGLREGFEIGAKLIIDYQLPDGGWGYGAEGDVSYRKDGGGDLSVTGWQFQALKAAKYSGLPFKGLDDAMARTVKYLVNLQTRDGGFGNTEREGSYNQWSLSGAALLGLQTLGHENDLPIKRGIRFATFSFAQAPPQWRHNANLYSWYYYSQAFFQYGGAVWRGWNERVLPQLLEHQDKDGSWKQEQGNIGPATAGAAGQDQALYRATLCTLMLEVYYRYLRVGDRQARSIFERS